MAVDPPTKPELASSNGSHRPLRILLITESLIDQKLADRLLSKEGHHVSCAASPTRALREFESAEYDVVVVELFPQDLDTATELQSIRERAMLTDRRVTVLALVDGEQENDQQAMQLAFDGFVCKPLTPAQLANCLARISKSHNLAESEPATGDDQIERIDWTDALEAVGGRRELLQDLVEIFFTEYPPTLESIREAIVRHDAKQLQLSAHKLKGCLRYFGPSKASEIAQKLENIGRSGQLLSADTSLEDLNRALTRMLPGLKSVPT